MLGAGEIVERLPKTWHLAAVLLTSEVGVGTAEVYAHFDRLDHGRRHLDHECRNLQEAVTTAGYAPLEFAAMLQNDLQHAALELAPQARPALTALTEAGAHVALLSGSGPTAFGLFDSDEAAEAARAALAPRWSGEAVVVRSAPSDYAVVRTL